MAQVLLETLVVRFRGKNSGKFVRSLIDTASTKSYISKHAAAEMGYEVIGIEKIKHGLFGGTDILEEHKKYRIYLSNLNNEYHCNFEVYDQKTICSDIPRIDINPILPEIKDRKIYLSDAYKYDKGLIFENSSEEIHVLIGANVAGKLFTGIKEQLSSGLVCMETLLGWTIMGKTDSIKANDRNNLVLSLHVNDYKISYLWLLDSLGIRDPAETQSRRDLDQVTKEHFAQSIKRDEEGRYEVSLPWINNHPPLPSCRNIAERRLERCISKLRSSENLEAYEAVFDNWLEEAIIEEVETLQDANSEHFLPHRAVFKENSTTPIRPVFDGSAKEKDSPSINDCLDKGPNIIELIPSILNRFRKGKIGVTADIKKSFLQIGLNKNDRAFLRFLWWKNGDRSEIRIYQHRRVVFGLSCSPYLLGATLEYHLKHVPEHLQKTASKLLESFYVDNCVTSVNDDKELYDFIAESQLILRSAKFDLRGWESSILDPRDNQPDNKENRKVPVLGLNWYPEPDTLGIELKEIADKEKPVTKRIILSSVHKIFDPIGFTCPVTLGPKLLLQECWKLKVSWDEELPTAIVRNFEKWTNQLSTLKDITIPRCIVPSPETSQNLTIHVFCDASKLAYATCIYLRVENLNEVTCQLVQARSRVAPMKSLTIPRLELMACNIGARLAQTTKKELGMENVNTFYWTDSSNALCWIQKNENWSTFVLNRVKEIRKMSNPEDWHFIPGAMNPADLPSRSCGSNELARSRWWEGPNWLRESVENWPKSDIHPDLEIVNKEKRVSIVSAANTSVCEKLFDRFSSFEKIITIVTWIYRFFRNCRLRKENQNSGPINESERRNSEIVLMRFIQKEAFSEPEDERLRKLQAMTDSNDVIGIKTRILRRKDSDNFRFPIVLPSKHDIVHKLIRDEHKKNCHAGVQFLISSLREKYWILKSRKTIRQVVWKCVQCRRFDGKLRKTPIAPLPEDRVRDATIFEIVGVDLTGPLILRQNQKAWIVVFTCAIFRAVHFEIVFSLSTESFLLALRRFVARRGRPHIIYSDNGTNFTGASNLFRNIDWGKVLQVAIIDRIKWKFIPPSAPWWGGWWERLIGVLKRILRKVLGRTSLDHEEMVTILCECENIMNNRPLTYISEDVEDLIPLTPSMFLNEIRESGVPDFEQLDASSLTKRLTYRSKLKQDLRMRFRSEYLGQLRQKYLRFKDEKPIEIGEVVIVSSDNLRKLDWPLAKVVEVFKDKDGHIRLVKVKTKSGEFLRPVSRLLPLEVRSGEKIEPFQQNSVIADTTSGQHPNVARSDDHQTVQDNSIVKTRYGRTSRPVIRTVY